MNQEFLSNNLIDINKRNFELNTKVVVSVIVKRTTKIDQQTCRLSNKTKIIGKGTENAFKKE